MAQQLRERVALARRISAARTAARAQRANKELRRLFSLATTAETVFNRKLVALQEWVSGRSPVFFGFHHEQSHQMRPALDVYERMRAVIEGTINPNYFQHLNTAALGGTGAGLVHYGPYRITLDERTISHRTSIFEKNPFIFCKEKGLVAGQESPPGYRAEYSSKGALAVAKLGDQVKPGMDDADLWVLLMDEASGASQDCDFIEAHIYGPIHRNSIVGVKGPRPVSKADRAIWEDIKDRLAARGVPVEETT